MLQEDYLSRIPEIDLDNKLILPTLRLYDRIGDRLNILYREISELLIEIHGHAATLARQFYDHPLASLNAWYEQGAIVVTDVQTRIDHEWLPNAEALYRHWQARAAQDVDAVGEYWRYFQQQPEQCVRDALATMTHDLDSVVDGIGAMLIQQYYVLTELWVLIANQPVTLMQSALGHALSKLLDVYCDAISSILIMI